MPLQHGELNVQTDFQAQLAGARTSGKIIRRFHMLFLCLAATGVIILLPHSLYFSGFLLSILCQSCLEQVFHPRLQGPPVSQEPKGEYLGPVVTFCLYSRSNSSL